MPQKSQTQPVEAAEQNLAQQETRKLRFRRELLGMFYGIAATLMISAIFPDVRANFSLGLVVLWGGAIGGLLASYERFERAGAALTRSENTALNYAVGFGIPLIILAVFYFSGR